MDADKNRRDTNMDKLHDRLIRAFQSGLLVQFGCNPTSAKAGDKVQIIAVFFAQPNTSLNELEPFVTCRESDRVKQKLSLEPGYSKSQMKFGYELDTSHLAAGTFTLLLNKRPDERPVASTTLEIFEKSEIENLRASLKYMAGF